MKTAKYISVGVMVVLITASLQAKEMQSIKLSVEVDKPVLLADTKQPIYLRVGLTGCPGEGLTRHVPVNVAIVIDKSGSMSSDGKMKKAKEAAMLAVERLSRDDILSIVAYNHNVQVLLPATKLTDKQAVREEIRRLQADGSTALYAGVQKGADEVRKFLVRQRVNRIVLISDGLANVGPSSPDELGRLGSRLAKEGVSVTTVGLGLGYNEDLMSKLAFCSDGGHYFAEKSCDLTEIFDKEFSRTLSVVAQDVRIEITCPDDIRPVRILGRDGKIDGQKILLSLNHIYSNHEKYAVIELEAASRKNSNNMKDVAEVIVCYNNLLTRSDGRTSAVAAAKTSSSETTVKSGINKRVMADVVELLAVERNEMAMNLRDQGRIEEARQKLDENALYLQTAAKDYGCQKLDSYAAQNADQAEQLDDKEWNQNRKGMVEGQTMRKSQR